MIDTFMCFGQVLYKYLYFKNLQARSNGNGVRERKHGDRVCRRRQKGGGRKQRAESGVRKRVGRRSELKAQEFKENTQ